MESLALFVSSSVNAGTVLALAALGLLLNERAGVVNLGAEGMMLVGALAAYATAFHTGSLALGFAAGAAAGAVLAAGCAASRTTPASSSANRLAGSSINAQSTPASR